MVVSGSHIMEKIYEQFENYDFNNSPSFANTLDQVYSQYLIVLSDKDLEVKEDLSNGVFNPERIPQADREQLQLQTKIFVFCSETDNILELQDYQFWSANRQGYREQSMVSEDSKIQEIDTNEELNNPDENINLDTNEEYTSNYQEIVDMIVNNKPIPGIKQIPKTILDPSNASKSVLHQRLKPWENNESPTENVENVINNVDTTTTSTSL